MNENNTKIKYLIFFPLFLIFYYSLSIIIFEGFIFQTPTDMFDSELVFNEIIGDIFKGDFYKLEGLLNGEYKWYYFTRIFFITNLFYTFFETELAFLLIDFLVKLFAFITFFHLSKFLKNENFLSFLLASIYSFSITSINDNLHQSIFGFGLSVLPYLTYLILKNKKLKLKNYFFIIFAGINSHFYVSICIIFFPIMIYLLSDKKNLIFGYKVCSIFFISCIFVNSNLLYISLFSNEILNRDIWNKETFSFLQNIINSFKKLVSFPIYDIFLPGTQNEKIFYLPRFLELIPYTLTSILVIFLLAINKIQRNLSFLGIIFFIFIISTIEKTELYTGISNSLNLGIIKSISLERFRLLYSFIFIFALANLNYDNIKKKRKISNYSIKIITLLILIIFVSNRFIIPTTKKELNYSILSTVEKNELKKNFFKMNFSTTFKLFNKYRKYQSNNENNYITINNYYDKNNFLFIKKVVKDDVVLPIDIDPMKFIYNDIKVIGGLFQFYPLSYKIKFRKIIEEELNRDSSYKKYFDLHGHRIYAQVKDTTNVKINFKEAKKMQAKYIVSANQLRSDEISLICENCNKGSNFYLYKIK